MVKLSKHYGNSILPSSANRLPQLCVSPEWWRCARAPRPYTKFKDRMARKKKILLVGQSFCVQSYNHEGPAFIGQ